MTSANRRPLRVLTVDDSSFFLRVIRRSISGIPDVRVVGVATSGEDAIREVKLLKPDVLTLDMEMPGMNGLDTLRAIRDQNLDVKVVMVSSHTEAGARKTMEALDLGASDFIAKPSSRTSEDNVSYLREQLQKKLCGFQKPLVRSPLTNVARRMRAPAAIRDIVLIAISTGGPRALSQLLPKFPKGYKGSILVAQHMPAVFTKTLAERLDRLCALRVSEGVHGEKVEHGRIYIAPGGLHMEVDSKKCLHIHEGPRLHGCRPAADHLFRSAASVYGNRCLGVIMTGMGNDGSDGAEVVLEAGGAVVGQEESTCAVWGMPRQAASRGLLEESIPLGELAAYILKNTKC